MSAFPKEGIWTLPITTEANLPRKVLGNDLSANMPTFVPPNVKFEVDDVESEWLHGEKFSWIFCRYMAASIHDWSKLVSNIYGYVLLKTGVYCLVSDNSSNLEPGGWCEFQDFDLQYYSEDGSLAPDDPLFFWISTLLDAARSLNREPNPGSQLEGWVKAAGFRNVVHKRYRIPIGAWPLDPALKEIGLLNHAQISGGLEGLSMRLYTNVLKWKPEEVLLLLDKVRKDLRDPNKHGMFDLYVFLPLCPEVVADIRLLAMWCTDRNRSKAVGGIVATSVVG